MNVIGGGPVGLWVAKKSSDKGVNVIVHEEHSRIGEPEHCTGLHSLNLNRIIKPEIVLNYVNGAKFISGKQEVIIEREKAAEVIDRTAFDKQLYVEALSSGAEVKLGSKAKRKDFKGPVVMADGAFGGSARDFNQKLGFLPAMQFDLKQRPESDFVELWFEDWNKDYFVWVVPRGNSIRVGTAGRGVLGLKNFILKRFGNFKPERRYAGLVITSGPVKKTYFKESERDTFLVGDAAGQVKPTTGGGVFTGMKCAEHLANAIVGEDYSAYEKNWKSEFGKEFQMQKIARYFMNKNPEGFVKFLKKNKTQLEMTGDMDMQFQSLSKLVLSAVPWVLGGLF